MYQNHIVITHISDSYDCATGQVTVRFRIKNIDQSGRAGGYVTAYTVNTSGGGRSRVLPEGNDVVEYTGIFSAGDLFYVTAYGFDNNDAPETTEYMHPTVPAPPDAPTISMNATMPLCNGVAATLTASGSTGNYIWSNGATGASIQVTQAGTYTVRAIGQCGESAPSNAIVVTTDATPVAPTIGSSAGNLLCNIGSTVLSATSSGGTINWSNGQSGNSFSTTVAGSYYASETNGCGTSGNSNVIVITTAQTPSAPTVNSSNGTVLCNGSNTTLSTSPSAGGSIFWNTGANANSIIVSSPGDYYAYETNACGTGAISNVVSISTGGAPAAPVVSSSNGTLICNGASTTLSASGSGAITWSTGASGNSIAVNASGNYYATASNNCGTSAASNTIVIATNQTPTAPTVSTSNGSLLCNGASTTLSAAPSFGGTINWSTGAVGNSILTSTAGNYYAYEVNGCGTGTVSAIRSITTASTPVAPVVNPSGDQLLCNGASVVLSASGSNLTWNTGAVGNSITVSTAGSYYVYDRNACGNSANSNVVRTNTVVCPVPLPGASFMVCPGAQKTLDAGAGYDTYLWSNGATTRTIAVGPGIYSVTVTKDGCAASSAQVTVGYYTVVTPTISASGATSFCAGGSVGLTASSGAGYLWSNGATSQTINVGTAGVYYVSVTDANGCSATSAAVGVTVNPLPTATISGNTTVCLGTAAQTIRFTGANGTAPYTFSYRLNGGSVQAISTSVGNTVDITVPTHTAGVNRYTLVAVAESSATACSNAASGEATVLVNALPAATISGNATVCFGSTSPQISFTGLNGTAPYTFTYKREIS